MKTIVYLIRHSEPFKVHRGITKTTESILLENEKTPLSINGEKMAEQWSIHKEMKDLDVIWSSNYVRAMSTAKYFAYINGLKVNIDERFNERVHGVNSWNELPENFEKRQMLDVDFKVGYGESQREVADRMYNALNDILNVNNGKKIAIVSHATAIMFLLIKLCDYKNNNLYFKNELLIDENFKWDSPEVFKLEFDDKKLINVKNIKYFD